MHWLVRLFEDANGVPDEARVMACLMVLGYLGNSAWAVIGNHQPFDAQQWGIGAGALAAGIGAWFGIRKDN